MRPSPSAFEVAGWGDGFRAWVIGRSGRLFHVAVPRWGRFGRGGQVVAVAQRSSQSGAQGQSLGRWRVSRRAVVAIRAGTATR